MQAIILAAGMGTRLKELTRNNTKCMIDISGKKLIDYTIDCLLKHNIRKIIIVTGYCDDNLENHLTIQYPTIPISFVNNPLYSQTNNIYSLFLAKEYLNEDDTILLESDLIFEEKIISRLLSDPYPNLSVVAPYQYWMSGTMVELDKERRITSFILKSAFEQTNTSQYYKTVNIHKFSKKFSRNRYIPFLEAYTKAFGNSQYYEEVLGILTQIEKTELKGLPLENEKWYEIDDVQDYQVAQTLFSAEKNILNNYKEHYGGYWRFPDMIDFCYLVNPFFPTKQILEEIKQFSITLLTSYPSGSQVNNRLAANFFNISPDCIVLANGASELIKALMNILRGKTGIIYPTFEEYPNCLEEQAKVCYTVNSDNFSYGSKDIKEYFEDKDISSLLLINPDNPSGNMIEKKQVLDLLLWAGERNIFMLLDESFIDFSGNGQEDTLLDNKIIQDNPHLAIIKSVSKSYGVPGIRLGILATSNKDIIDQVNKQLPIWNINSYGEFFMQIIDRYRNDYKQACIRFMEEREYIYSELCKITYLRVIPSKANYFLCEVTSQYSSKELTRKLLLEYNIFIKDCSDKKGIKNKEYVRVAIKDRFNNNKLLTALKMLRNENK
ncbi:aminotransferase class I/II-fold pyridoxal phosphate-dependent enzyme [Dysgonomonas termitidis]|uniref:Aminotransferase n=1 Tax=Dysgonomonas termitidis TaxID=1516126 RepID=A0ABV9KZD1_9BACT